MNRCFAFSLSLLAAASAGALLDGSPAWGQTYLRDICRVKGQEENTLQGIGLVVGLKGTGDSDVAPTARALARMMELMAHPVGRDAAGEYALKELEDARNVALVLVAATVPSAGGRQGDRVDCTVSAISAKSLVGGQLMMTPLLGPRPGSERIYAFAQGPVHVENPEQPATAKVHLGCRLEEDFFNVFLKDGKITLVLDSNHAGFQAAQDVADQVNSMQAYFASAESADSYIAKALDQVNIEVKVPTHYLEDPVLFVSQILNQRISHLQTEARVVVNRNSGSIVIGGNVAIGPVVVAHKNNIVVEAGVAAPTDRFVPLSSAGESETAKLKDLVDALNAVKAAPGDIIDILEGLERDGKLYGRLIVE
jgi:flagellar P-ring protein precursor FlgI